MIIPFVPLWPRIRALWVVLYFVGAQIIPAIVVLLTHEGQREPLGAPGGFFSSIFILLFIRPEAYARYLSDTLV